MTIALHIPIEMENPVFDRYITAARAAVEELIASFNETTACLVEEMNDARDLMHRLEDSVESESDPDTIDALRQSYNDILRQYGDSVAQYTRSYMHVTDGLATIRMLVDEANDCIDPPSEFGM